MHVRVIMAVSTALFALLAMLALVISDVHDRAFPESVEAKAAVSLDTTRSTLSDAQVYAQLAQISDRAGLGLVKVLPQLGATLPGEAIVPLGKGEPLPQTFERFGDQAPSMVRPSMVLENSYASGNYIVLGDPGGRTALEAWALSNRVRVRWTADTPLASIKVVFTNPAFAVAVIAGITVMISLALYWLTVRARGRALRVLAGSPAWRIQLEDLYRFVAALTVGATVTGLAATLYVGIVHGWHFVRYYAATLAMADAVVLGASAGAAVVIAATSWPTTRSIASRAPAAVSLRRAATVFQVAVFVLVVAATGPAVAAQRSATDRSADQAQWRKLSDQVSLSFSSGTGDPSLVGIAPRVGELVQDADAGGDVALSATLLPESFGRGLVDFGQISLVNRRWLDLFGQSGTTAPAPLRLDQLSPLLRDDLSVNFAMWARDKTSPDSTVASLQFFDMTARSAVPLSEGGSGDLLTVDRALLVVVPDVYATFDDDFLAAVASSSNLVFTGLGSTEALVKQHGLAKEVSVRYVAEEQILIAQFAEYFAHLAAASIGALFVALGIAAAVAASITALVRARHDFPMRLAGYRWTTIIAGRVACEWAVAAGVVVVVVLVLGFDQIVAVLGVAVLAVLLSLLSHLAATRWMFTRISSRKA